MSGIEVNKFMTLDDLEKQYPDMWAFYDIDKSGTDRIYDWNANYFILAVCKFADQHEYIIKYRNEGLRFNHMRTSEPPLPFWGTQF